MYTNNRVTIGITEGGDPAYSPCWEANAKSADGTIVITKNLTTALRNAIRRNDARSDGRTIVHATCTGFGGTMLEPNVPMPHKQAENLFELITAGFPAERCVWRADPAVPTEHGLERLALSLESLDSLNALLPDTGRVTRVRLSILDNYPHVRERFREAGLPELYGGAWNASDSDLKRVKRFLSGYTAGHPDIHISLCAETRLAGILEDDTEGGPVPVDSEGCVSERDLALMGFSPEAIRQAASQGVNGQNRGGCRCIACKKELIPNRGRCPSGCLYCYWKGAVQTPRA